jgi:hypothetical protein
MLPTHLPTHLPLYPYLPTYLPTHLPTYLPTHLPTHLPTYPYTLPLPPIGFRTVDRDAYTTRLIHVKGKRTCRSWEVPCGAASLNTG